MWSCSCNTVDSSAHKSETLPRERNSMPDLWSHRYGLVRPAHVCIVAGTVFESEETERKHLLDLLHEISMEESGKG